ncbi:MAG: hypothetical protein N4A35_03350 [Flavobacteriales bacterium]|nr:hypothetical protein [Flavobacteriales bacterium]
MKNWWYLLILCSPVICLGQNIIIPDVVFKAYLVNNPAINTNNDNEIQLLEAQAFSGGINVCNKGISDLSGIEYFINLRLLNCSRNNLTSIDLSNNLALQSLYCNRNNLNTLDISALIGLNHLQCNNNNLVNLNLSSCINLKSLYCSDNNISSLNLSTTPSLYTLFCFNNPLTTLNISSLIELSDLKCNNTQLTTIDLSTTNVLSYLDCSGSNLSELKLSNGTANINYFDSRNNPGLSCIEVDNVVWATYNLTLIDGNTSFSLICP